jgi:hypothetical protein
VDHEEAVIHTGSVARSATDPVWIMETAGDETTTPDGPTE